MLPSQHTQDSTDRRVAARIALQVEVGFHDHTNFYVGFSENISSGGLFVATHALIEPGTQIDLTFRLPDDREITAKGTVRWQRDPHDLEDPDAPPGMGVQFSELDEEAQAAIEEFLHLRAPMFYPD